MGRIIFSIVGLTLAAASFGSLPKVITRSIKLQPGIYSVKSAGLEAPALEIRGDNITVDATGVVLMGSSDETRPDLRRGLGVRVLGKNVRIRGLAAHGYMVGVLAKDATGLHILDGDFSYNWKQELRSGREREDMNDWMSFHQNEKNEWLRYGAGIYLNNCDKAEVKRTRIVGGQCGLMITQTDGALIIDNNFSFLSAVGLGLYRSSDNLIFHNKIDWCVRGYSHGIYNRGQDSTGILIYEQSHRNRFGFNSVTHGGDGFFLWAGQTTMDTGKGGCNDNILYGNDFSHAPTNGIEATFSRNMFVNNLIMECWHGVWGGYSYESVIDHNLFAYNGEAIAIEHGQTNQIANNIFYKDANAIRLWMNIAQDPDWGYPKTRDTSSRGYQILENQFRSLADAQGGLALRIDRTKDIVFQGNTTQDVPRILRARSSAIILDPAGNRGFPPPSTNGEEITMDDPSAAKIAPVMKTSGTVVLPYPGGLEGYQQQFRHTWDPTQMVAHDVTIGGQRFSRRPIDSKHILRPVRGAQNAFLKPGDTRGRRFIMVDNWGPYDFQRPILWLRETTEKDGVVRGVFDIMGPKGRVRVLRTEGLKLSAQSAPVPATLTAEWSVDQPTKVIEMEYVGEKVVDGYGRTFEAGKRVPFSWRDDSFPMTWTMEYWNYSADTQDPRKLGSDFRSTLGEPKVVQRQRGELNNMWWRAPAPEINADHFATQATTSFTAPAGDYVLEITADDGVRAFLDDRWILDEWKYSGPTTYTVPLKLGGTHRLDLRHFELDGFAQLSVKLRRRF